MKVFSYIRTTCMFIFVKLFQRCNWNPEELLLFMLLRATLKSLLQVSSLKNCGVIIQVFMWKEKNLLETICCWRFQFSLFCFSCLFSSSKYSTFLETVLVSFHRISLCSSWKWICKSRTIQYFYFHNTHNFHLVINQNCHIFFIVLIWLLSQHCFLKLL